MNTSSGKLGSEVRQNRFLVISLKTKRERENKVKLKPKHKGHYVEVLVWFGASAGLVVAW